MGNYIENTLEGLIEEHDEIIEKISALKQILSDTLFVPYRFYTNRSDNVKQFVIEQWCFDNNIISIYETGELLSYRLAGCSIEGFRFKTEEDAMAFKLRWS